MQEQLLARIQELVAQGQTVSRDDGDYWVNDVSGAQAWMASAANVIQQIAPVGSFYREEIGRLTTHPELKAGIPSTVLQKILGVLRSVQDEARGGLLAKIEYQIFATAFDDFLDHATEFHKSGKAREAAVLVSAVLEDTLKRVAVKNGLAPAGASLDPLIDELMKLGVFTPVKAKRMKSFAGVRNSALHAEWEKLDLKDIGNAIDGVRELLDDYL
jgi:uncharacterized protein YutE (UPF0331/DUF86 family)